MTRFIASAFLVLCTLVVAAAADEPTPFGEVGKVTMVDAGLNPTALELMGTWVPGSAVGEELGLLENQRNKYVDITLAADAESTKVATAQLEAWLAKGAGVEAQRALQAVYLTGSLHVREAAKEGRIEDWGTMPFALVAWNGTPMIIYFADGTDREMLRVQVIRDVRGDKDILLFGGSSVDSLHIPMVRKK